MEHYCDCSCRSFTMNMHVVNYVNQYLIFQGMDLKLSWLELIRAKQRKTFRCEFRQTEILTEGGE